jgi:hypothetical protein
MYISGYDTYNWIFFEAFTLSDGWQLFRVSSEFRTQVAIPMTSKKRMTAKSQSYHLKGDQIVTDH